MSAIDPILAEAISFSTAAAVLQELFSAELAIGDVVTATVLPPQAGQDFLEISGQPVAATLPPAVYPGTKLFLRVTEIDGTRISMRNLGPAPAGPSAPLREAPVVSPPREAPVVSPPREMPAAPPREARAVENVRQMRAMAAPAVPERLEARLAATRVTLSETSSPLPHPAPARTYPPPAVLSVARRAPAHGGAQMLLAALRVPMTPITLAAARVATHAPAVLPRVLARLDALLPRAVADTRVATLRTLIGFLARIDPGNERALPQQISAYVSHVLEGAEKPLAALLRAHGDGASVRGAAQVAERTIARDHDLKTLVLSLIRQPPAQSSPALSQALGEALTTLTGAQLNAHGANPDSSNTLTLNVPIMFYEGAPLAQIRIDRDAPARGEKLDADNFHVAFVLETATLGTVAIDLETIGRQVRVDVKTERGVAADRFAETLPNLRSRLEALRYRVSSMKAAHAAPAARTEPSAAVTRPGLDLQA
ncbi:MAG: hypothetical protein M3R35_05640 [Candidatus Eremiobacteraeota bacterium]|nr:hypothetical protein [Candidatus Eremiobacteraeota bacterium]